ncbi:CGNR zinc finger domain-containing protein [Actinoplanes sp. NPDC049548]|uniref:CGNR zinc finger domain-containing protein n=1 Tax=Actinoplanes sp. NPDC049548 TaxID=3155152 RepID=UPI0034450CBD
MVFAHDTEVALIAAAALVNTVGRGGEQLPDVAALDAFLRAYDWTGRREGSRAELRDVQRLRPRLRRLWEAGEVEVVGIVNALLRESHALPQLVRHGDWPYHLHATPQDAPLATRMAVEAAMAFVDVVRDRQLDRLRLCDAADCDGVVVDLTRNRSKRFCDTGCGNRAAVSAYRARKAAAARERRTSIA